MENLQNHLTICKNLDFCPMEKRLPIPGIFLTDGAFLDTCTKF